jgi:hypothetical protein
MKKSKKAVILIPSFLGLIGAHLFLQYKMLEIGTTWSYSKEPPNEIFISIFTAFSYFLNPLVHLAGYVDSELIRIKDHWYYISAVVGAMLWASVILWAGLRLGKKKSQPGEVVNARSAAGLSENTLHD